MRNYNKIVSENLRTLRQDLGLTQTELAEIVGKNLRTVQKYESGEISISITLLGYLADLFDVDVAMFFEQQEVPKTIVFVELDR